MKLTLRLAAPAAQPGQMRVLTEGRLSIGRGADNDWMLADPDRTLSKNHCRIDASETGFMLTDLSTNGVFVAGQRLALGRGHSCALENGDSFSLGPYTMSAAIERDGAGEMPLEQGLGLPAEDEEAIFPTGRRAAETLSPIAPAIAEPWLTDIPGGAFGPGRRAAPQGWDAPPDPATYAASGVFEAQNPLDPRRPVGFAPETGFSHASEQVAAPSTVMRVPQPQVVLPSDWNEVPAEPAPAPGRAAPAIVPDRAPLALGADWAAPAPVPGRAPLTPVSDRAMPALDTDWAKPALAEEAAPPALAWPPALPSEPEPEPEIVLPPAWMAAPPADDWERPAPQVALPESWSEPAPMPALLVPDLLAPVPVPAPAPALAPVPAAAPPPAPQPRAVPSQAVPDIAEPPPAPAGEASQLIAAFLEGAGLSPDTLQGADAEKSFRDIGQMVRAAVDGMRDILATRALVKNEFRVDRTVLRRNDNNAMKFAPDAERCLAAMIGAAPPGFLPGPDAMRQSMEDIKRHELALVAAINTVFADLGRQLDPELIMQKARQETGLGTMLPYAREVRCWAIYTETHALLQDSGAVNTGGSLLAPVAQAYDNQLRRGG